MRPLAALLALNLACIHQIDRKVSPVLETVDHKAPYLKVHLRNGDLYVLSKWTADEVAHVVRGTGELMGVDRQVVGRGEQQVAMADVVLYETNTIETSPSIAGMAIVAGVTAAITAVCVINPKACFGSCPTFYAPGEGGAVLQAEGFSDAIAPALETHDIDALWRTHVTDGHLHVRVTNEAYETHVIKQADILAVRRPAGSRVLSTGEALWLASDVVAPTSCTADEGDCTAAVAAVDSRERTSLSDEHDLAAREVIELSFAPGAGRAGIVIAARQSLVTTFLLYQGLAYLGTTAGDWLAALERGERAGHDGAGLSSVLGGIEVQVPHGEGWRTVGEVYETGPLAIDVHLLVLPEGVTGDRVRLRLPKGGWRIDHVARARLVHQVADAEIVRVAPRAIRGTLSTEFAGGRAPATALPLVTQPGDAYDLDYDVPAGEVELFVDSRGYYFEWMRQSWLDETQPLAAVKMLLDPAKALRDLAPAWKRMEPKAEQLFWSSRYAHP